MKIPGKIILALCLGLFLVITGIVLTWNKPAVISPEKFLRVLDEINSVELAIRDLTPDPTGTILAYVRATEQGRGLILCNLKTLKQTEILLTNEVTQMNGWSPDGRYLAFVQRPDTHTYPKNKFGLPVSWVTIYDRQNNSVQRLTENSNVMEHKFFWLSTNAFFFDSRSLTKTVSDLLLGRLDEKELVKIANSRPDPFVISETVAGYVNKGEIFGLEVEQQQTANPENPYRTFQLSNFGKQFDEMKWVRFSQQTSNFLFCARPSNEDWRYLYAFDPKDQKLTQISNENAYNGQWLQQGGGLAYVVNTNNGFYLAVRPKEKAASTNLFTDGGLVSYSVAPDGEHIYSVAACDIEPYGIWEYSLTNQQLRCVAGGSAMPFVETKLIKPKQFQIKSFDTVEIPCFLFPPVQLAAENGGIDTNRSVLQSIMPGTKYPAVIYVPPTSSQFQKSFEERSQMVANLGFYFMAVNYRGCDGYGRDYSELSSVSGAAKDILAAYQALIDDPQVDKGNIFLWTVSAGVPVTIELLTETPALWRGALFDKPGGFHIDENRISADKMPPLLILTATQDPALPAIQMFKSWALDNGVPVTYIVHTNAEHFSFKMNERRDRLEKTGQFLLNNLK